jgi:acyl-CoA thioester hydrolase
MEPRVDPTPFILSFEVRDYECDMEGIVNNAIYQNYLEHARHRFFSTLGVSFAELTRSGIHPVVVRAEIDYKRPLRSGDRFLVSVAMERVSRLRFAFLQEIRLDSAAGTPPAVPTAATLASLPLVAAARIIAAAMNDTGRPVPLEKWGEHAEGLVAAIGEPT